MICVCDLKVLVIIDVKPKDLGLPTEAYISVEEVHDVRSSLLFLFIILYIERDGERGG